MISVHTNPSWFGKYSVILTPGFACSVCTIRSGLFGKMNTMVCEGDGGYDGSRIVGEMAFHPYLSKEGIMAWHDQMACLLDGMGGSGMSLFTAAGLIRVQ